MNTCRRHYQHASIILPQAPVALTHCFRLSLVFAFRYPSRLDFQSQVFSPQKCLNFMCPIIATLAPIRPHVGRYPALHLLDSRSFLRSLFLTSTSAFGFSSRYFHLQSAAIDRFAVKTSCRLHFRTASPPLEGHSTQDAGGCMYID